MITPLTAASVRQFRINEATKAVRQRWGRVARMGVILGTGMKEMASRIEDSVHIPYADMNLHKTNVLGHEDGGLVCGMLAGTPVVAMKGRHHIYEGHCVEDITLPVRVMHNLGAEILIATNASGGMNPKYQSGDIMVMEDHINMMGARSRRAYIDEEAGRVIRPAELLYDTDLIEFSLDIARRENFTAHRGVYVAMTGPNYETRAEYRFLRRIGGDVVGMSTVPEVMVASELGMRVLAISIVTNVAKPDIRVKTDPKEVVAVGERAEPHLHKIVMAVAESID